MILSSIDRSRNTTERSERQTGRKGNSGTGGSLVSPRFTGKAVVFIKSFVPTGFVLLAETVGRLKRYCKETEVKYR